jgi:hypothetical protein
LVGGVPDFLLQEPVAEAASAPLGEVAGADGDALKVLLDDFLDFGEPVEPGEEFAGFLAVVEALVEFLADGGGEAGDFAGALAAVFGGMLAQRRRGRREGVGMGWNWVVDGIGFHRL